MGSGPSAHHQPHDMMVEPHQYPDMNVIFRGIPKMMQVADDMHRMTDYIMDLRNMTFALMIISTVGVVLFLILRGVQSRSGKRRRRSFLRHAEEGYPHGSMPRYYYQSQYAPEPWDRPKSTFSHQSQPDQEKKALESRNSPETKPNGNLSYKSPLEDSFSPELIKKASSQTNPPEHSSRLPHKRSLEPIKLLVEDLPYADT